MHHQHTLPVPPALLTRACDAVIRFIRPMPFERRGVRVDRDLIGTAMEELNAQPGRTLALRHIAGTGNRLNLDGLDLHLAHRGFADKETAIITAELLEQAGITQKTPVSDRRLRRMRRGTRLLPAWTWTIATGRSRVGKEQAAQLQGGSSDAPWTTLCPVCRSGSLAFISGQQLFGVSQTDYFGCTHCGAKFVPDSSKFRLVAIAQKQDPLWGDLVNLALSEDEWQAIAQENLSLATGRMRYGKRRVLPRSIPASTDTGEPDNRLLIELNKRTLYFTKISLRFGRGGISELFARRREPVKEILKLPQFLHLAPVTETQYPHFLNLPSGFFVHDLKSRRDPFYKNFLNAYGDQKYCSFQAGRSDLSRFAGVYVIALDGALQAAGAARDSFKETIDTLLGAIQPQTCYSDGDAGRCRINSLICRVRQRAGFFVHPLHDDDEITRTAAEVGAQADGPGAQTGA